MEPRLVRKMIIAGTGPAGGEGISKVARVTYLDMVRGFLTCQDPKQFLFFTRTPAGIRAGQAFLARLKERSHRKVHARRFARRSQLRQRRLDTLHKQDARRTGTPIVNLAGSAKYLKEEDMSKHVLEAGSRLLLVAV